jgi:hypothetical protein
MVGRVIAVSLSLMLLGATTLSQRVGHTFSNGNCAIGTDGRLTGKCVAFASTPGACVSRPPDPSSPACKPGVVAQRTRQPPCNPHEQPVAYDYQCFFITP